MMVLAPTIAFLTVDGPARRFGPREKTALAALLLAPLVARNVAQATLIPFGVLAMLATFVLLLRRTSVIPSLRWLLSFRDTWRTAMTSPRSSRRV
jgi:hypothetical protein